jgi:putative N6-adenine-specific DNA methylase
MNNKNTTQQYVAKTLFGLEDVLANELTNLGAKNISIAKRAVYFEGDEEILYLANLSLRTCLRILKPIKKVKTVEKFNF